MDKYVVICYSIHEKCIASRDVFDIYEDAVIFLEEDAQNTYEEEAAGTHPYGYEAREQIDFTMCDGTAYLSSCGGEYEWTWEIIKIKI